MIEQLERDVAALTTDPDAVDEARGRELLRELVDTVSRLTRDERAARVERLVEGSLARLEAAKLFAETDVTRGSRRVAAVVTMFSGGNDSTVLAHLFREHVTHVGMANTGIGIEQTREYVRACAAQWNLPVVEKCPPEGSTYRDLVLGQCVAKTGPNAGTRVYPGGFPGPGAHGMMFQRLKERAFEQIKNELVADPYRERVIFLAGRRATESERRNRLAFRAPIERRKSIVWCAPLITWTTLDLNTYRLTRPGVPVNEVSNLVHMSGECLCGCFAEENELGMLGDWYPGTREEIEKLEAEVREVNPPGVIANPRSATWGWGWAKRKPLGCECRTA